MNRLPILVLSTCLALAAAAPASADPLVRIDVVDREQGQWLPTYRSRNETWIAGTPGHRYGVRLTNTSDARVLVVLSIDGVNAVSGETAHPSQTGYVLAPRQSAEINGWRKSWQDVAAFVFTAVDDSYAARTGRPDNVGTIGVAVFRERSAPPPVARALDHSARRVAPAAAEAEAATADTYAGARTRQQLGTGHGAREWSPTGQTTFERAGRRPVQVTQLRYDSPQALAARGIVPRPWPHHAAPRAPQAFPGTFVQDPPPRWR